MWVTNTFLLNFGIFWQFLNMEVCSLEEEDTSELFITQKEGNSGQFNANFDLQSGFMGGGSGMQNVESAVTVSQYSDISDDDFEFPCSQIANSGKKAG